MTQRGEPEDDLLSGKKLPPVSKAAHPTSPRVGTVGTAATTTAAGAGFEFPEGDFRESALEAESRRLLEEIGCEALARQVKVCWNKRLRTTAGLACYAKCLVSLNPRLILFGMPEVDRTLRHELAHLLARFRTGRRRIEPHGPEWRQACVDLGLADEKRCHELPLPRRRVQRKFLYKCRNCQVEVWRVRPFRRAVACLKCCRTFNHGKYDERYKFMKMDAGAKG